MDIPPSGNDKTGKQLTYNEMNTGRIVYDETSKNKCSRLLISRKRFTEYITDR